MPEQVRPVLQKFISGHSNIVVVPVQVKIDNSITEGEEKGRLLQAHAKIRPRAEF